MVIRYEENNEIKDMMVDPETFDLWVDAEKMGIYATFGQSKRARLVKKSRNYQTLVAGMNALYDAVKSGFVDFTAV